MEDTEFDFESCFAHEFSSQNAFNNSDDCTESLLILKKRIILTDEVLGKFSEELTENEKLKAENEKLKADNLKYIEELKQCRETLLSNLTNDQDLQKKCNQLETSLLATQQQLDFQTNLVAARDSVVRQYVSLIKEKDEEIKKHRVDNQSLRNQTEEKKWKKKYNAALKRCDNLKGIIEKSQTCTSCQLLTHSLKSGKKVNKENDLDDRAIFSPGSCVPASISSIDTGFESSLSDSDCDLEKVSQKKIQRTLISEKSVSVISSENENHLKPEESIIEKCSDGLSRHELTEDEIHVKITVCDDEVNSAKSSLHPTALCLNCLNTKKDVADKYVQTRIIKYVDSCVEVKCDVQSTSTQTASPETKFGDDSELTGVLSTSVLTAPTAQLESDFCFTTEHLNLQENIPICETRVPQCTVSCQTIEHDNGISKSDVECQTEVKELVTCGDMGPEFQNSLNAFHPNEINFCSSLDESSQKQHDSENSEKPTDIFGTRSEYEQLFSPVPCLLSPMPPSPVMEDAGLMMEADESMSEMSAPLVSDEENESSAEELNDIPETRPVSFTDTATQTDDAFCVCHQTRHNYQLDAAVQCESTGEENTNTSDVRNTEKIPFNKYASKSKKEIVFKENDQIDAVKKAEPGGEEFWKKLVNWIISNDRPSSSQKESIMNLLHDRDMQEVIPEDRSFCGEIGTTNLPAESFQPISLRNKRKKLEGLTKDTTPIKPIMVEMNRHFEETSSVQKNFFHISDEHADLSKESRENCHLSIAEKPRKTENVKQKVEKMKMKTYKRIVKCASPKLDLKENKRITRYSLKRKQISNAHSEISCTSGSFIVASIPEFFRNREDLNEKNLNKTRSSSSINRQDPNTRNLDVPDVNVQFPLNINDDVTDLSSPEPKGQQSLDEQNLALLSDINDAENGDIPMKIRKFNPPCDNHFSDSYIMNNRISSKNLPSTSRENSVCDIFNHDSNLQEQHLSTSSQDRSCDKTSSMVQSKHITSNTGSFTESVISKASVQQVSKQCNMKSSNLDPSAVGIKFIHQAHSPMEISDESESVSSIEFEKELESTSLPSTGGTNNVPPVQDKALNSHNVSVLESQNKSRDVQSHTISNDSPNIYPHINSEMGGCNSDAPFSKLERRSINQVSECEGKKSTSCSEQSKNDLQKPHLSRDDNDRSNSLEKVVKECSKMLYSVEKEVSQKRMTLAKEKADSVLAVKETEYDSNHRNDVSSMPVNNSRIGALQKQSPIAESLFCRRGMAGRRKTLVKTFESSSSLPGPSSSAESEANNFSISTKQPRIARVPKYTTCAKEIENESFCKELSSVQVSPEIQSEVPKKTFQTTLSTTRSGNKTNDHKEQLSIQERPEKQLIVRKGVKPAFKRSKLQKLKQKYVKQRALVQTLTLDSTDLKPTKQNLKKSEREEPINTVSSDGVKDSVTLQDIALDMALSDSDESVCEENSRRMNYSEKEELNLEDGDSKVTLKPLSVLDTNVTNNQVSTKNKECFRELSSCENLAANSKEMLQEEKLIKITKMECVDNLDVNYGSVQNSYQMTESIAQDTTSEQILKNNSYTKSQFINCQSVLPDVDSTLSIDNSTNTIPSESVINSEIDCSLLESPLSPPESPNCDINTCHLPLTIPTSPVRKRTFESLDKRVDLRNSETSLESESESESDVMNTHESDSNEEEENASKAENNEICNDSGAGSLDNIKTKLRSWNKSFSPNQKKCQASNLLQDYYEHHFKKPNVKCKKGKALKIYNGKKRKIESLFEKYVNGEFTENALAEILEGCKTVVKGDCRIIVKYVVKYCKYSSEEETDFSESFPLNPTQQRLFTLIIKLENDHPTIINEVLNRIALVVCDISHHRYKNTLYCLARFFTAFCKFRNNKRRAQIFCYDALYCLKMKAHIVVFAVLTAFPECFPNANSAAGSSPIVQAIVNVIYMFGNANTYVDTKNLRTYLSKYYNYERDNLPTADNLMKQYTEEIKRGMIPEVEQAMLLVAKFKTDWKWTHEKVIKGCLLQTVDSWKKGTASDTAAAWCLKIIAYLAKTPPYEKIDVSSLMAVFENLLFSDTSPPAVKEACIFSLASLVQMDDRKVFLILKACKNEEYLKNSETLRNVLNNVLKKRNANWWNKFFRTK